MEEQENTEITLAGLKITNENLSNIKVEALADRPNVSASYGEGGLSASDLKKHFDKYSDILRERYNDLINYLSDATIDGKDIKTLIKNIETGVFSNLLKLYANEANTASGELTSLQNIIYSISAALALRVTSEELTTTLENKFSTHDALDTAHGSAFEKHNTDSTSHANAFSEHNKDKNVHADAFVERFRSHNGDTNSHQDIRELEISSVKLISPTGKECSNTDDTGDNNNYRICIALKNGTSFYVSLTDALHPLEIVTIDDFTENGERKLKIEYENGSCIIFSLDEIFAGIDNLVANKLDSENATWQIDENGEAVALRFGEASNYTEISPKGIEVKQSGGEPVKVPLSTEVVPIIPNNSSYLKRLYSQTYDETTGGTPELITADFGSLSNTVMMRQEKGYSQVETPYPFEVGIHQSFIVNIGAAKTIAQTITDIANKKINERVSLLEGMTIEYQELYTESYELNVPSQSANKAFIHRLEGIEGTAHNENSKNLLDPAIFGWDVNENGEIYYPGNSSLSATKTVTLPAGTYTVSSSYIAIGVGVNGSQDDGVLTYTFTLTEESDVAITLEGDYNGETEPGYMTIMLNEGESAEPFESYYTLKPVKVTAIESIGANLVDDVAIFESLGWVKQANGYWLGSAPNHKIFDNTEKKQGSMSISYMSKVLTAEGTNNSVLCAYVVYTDGSKEWQALTTDKSSSYALRKYTTPADKTVLSIFLSRGIHGTFEIKDLILNWGDLADYKPYSAEPIATYEIPEKIQALDGYGEPGFTFNFDDKSYHFFRVQSKSEEFFAIEYVETVDSSEGTATGVITLPSDVYGEDPGITLSNFDHMSSLLQSLEYTYLSASRELRFTFILPRTDVDGNPIDFEAEKAYETILNKINEDWMRSYEDGWQYGYDTPAIVYNTYRYSSGDLSDILTDYDDLKSIPVEPGGLLRFKNPYKQKVPIEVTFLVPKN